jgi:hypothetical protein
MTIPADLHGDEVYTVTHGATYYPLIPTCDESVHSFPDWQAAFPLTEKRMVSAIVYDQSDVEQLLLDFRMSSDCVNYVGTDGGKSIITGLSPGYCVPLINTST